MIPDSKIAQITKHLNEEILSLEDFTHCFLVEMETKANNKLDIFIQSDTGIKISECSRINKKLQKYLDETLLIGEVYILDVSSPGIGRAIRSVREYTVNIGRHLKVTPVEGKKFEAKLISVSPEEIELQINNKGRMSTQILSYDKIEKAIVTVKF